MEIMYPVAIIVCVLIGIVIYFKNFNKNNKYLTGKKVANTKYIKQTDYYKQKMKKYKLLCNIISILTITSIFIISILIARPVTYKTKSEEKYNRDIIIGLDISTSECEVNVELIKKFSKIIPSIKGDRIGIVIFNTSPVVYCPLTDDYDYIYECLDEIQKQLQKVIDNNGSANFDLKDIDAYTFWHGGTVANNQEKGSSLVGDGLARNFIFFSRFRKK